MSQVGRFYLFCSVAFSFAWIPVMYPFVTAGRGLSDGDFYSLNAIYYLTMCLLEVPTGLLADRLGRRVALVTGSFGLSLAFGMIYAAPGFLGMAAGMALMGVAHTLLSGADAAWLYDTLAADGHEERYVRAEGLAQWARMLGVSVAFLLGGALAQYVGFFGTFALSIALTATAGLVALTFEEPPRRASRRRPPLLDLASCLRYATARPTLRWALGYFVLLFVLLRLSFHFYQPYLHEVGFDDYLLYGLLLGVLNLVAAPFARHAHRLQRWLGERWLLTAMQLLMAASFLLLASFPYRFAVAFFLLQQIPFGLILPVTRGYTQRHVGSKLRATMFSLHSLVARLAVGLAGLLVAAAIERGVTLAWIYVVLGAVTVVLSGWLHFAMPRGRRGAAGS